MPSIGSLSRWGVPALLLAAVTGGVAFSVAESAADPSPAAPPAPRLAPASPLASTASPAGPATTAPLRFNRDIRPVLSDNCFHCHGPDSATRKANLRLDREDGLFGPRKGGRAVVRGKPADSLLYQRITATDPDDVMPPPDSHKSLSAAQKELFRRWIEQGAPWEGHWALLAPTRPPLPAVNDAAGSATANAAWAANPIDRFVLASLGRAGLAPAPEADRRTLARRVSLDLTGLPPTPEEVEAFVNDPAPDAYERLVDRLLASPHYGEHRARYWLDAARYADTHGLHFDNYREMWPYRDWVINAFNADMPYDRFTVEQLAGDLLPARTLEQQVASGFVRCGVTTNEGGTIAEENLVFYARERTETAARVWMGLTYNCCVCHDHKFDPISQKDFYSLSAFFNNSTMGPLDGNVKDTAPSVRVPRPEDRPRWERVAAELADARKQAAARRAEAKGEFDRWASAANADAVAAAPPPAGLKFHAPLSEGEGSTLGVTVDGQPRRLPLGPGGHWQPGHAAPQALQVGPGPAVEIPDAGDFDRDQPFTCAIWAKLPGKLNGAVVARMDDANGFRGWDLWVENDRLGSHIIQHWEDDALKVVSNKPLDPSQWHHLCLTYDGTGKAAGVKLYVDGEPQPARPLADKLRGTTRTPVPLKVGQRHATSPLPGLLAQDLRLYGRALPPTEVWQLAASTRVRALLAKAAGQQTPAEKNELFDWWLAHLDRASMDLTSRAGALEQEAEAIKARGAAALVMQEKPAPAKAYVLYRGEYDKRREEVGPATPAVLPPFPADAPRDRLGLARWLLGPDQPLTARVAVNRFWQELFGTGLVRTSEDFGVMGENPSHPELLDWLAVEFREGPEASGPPRPWDVKRLVKLMVMSATYRQSSDLTPEKRERDPLNRLLSRGPRFRMDGEMIRDYALASSGLLAPRLGGPSVRPYQPPGVWEAVAMPDSNTHNYQPDAGEGLYRRSLYTFWKRAAPPASMDLFNAPSREVCTVRRERTDTPLQALVTLNDPQFVEAARALAQGAIERGGATFDARLDWVARRLLARPLAPEEVAVARAAFADLSAFYAAHPDDARQLLTVGLSKRDEGLNPSEHAAWTVLANQLMNLDEVLNK